MKSTLTLFISFAAMLVLVGCDTTGPQPIAGVIGYSRDYTIGSVAPYIPFVSMQGKQTSFKKVSQPIAIVAFASTPGQACCRLVPELVTLAHRFRNEPVTVAQISLPTTKCPHGPGCVEYCNINDARLVSLCDADRIAWRAYGQPKPNTAILIGENKKIVAIESLDNLDSLARKAQKIIPEVETVEESMYEGG